MDNLYENLENYEDENIVAELKRENGELKCKLEEYTVAMDKLQKDFDKLSSEFKKLEMNYSSLLKTAKEEVKRKTLIITKLNNEKDTMVLNAIHNKNLSGLRRTRWQAGGSLPFAKERTKDPGLEKVKNKETGIAKSKISDERQHSRHTSSEERSSNSTDNITKSVNRLDERPSSQIGDAKENIAKEAHIPKPKAMSISNRRKSMPAIRSEAKFSTDEEGECSPATDASYHKVNYDKGQHNIYKTHFDKNRLLDDRHRASETSSMEDRYSGYQEPNKDYRNMNNRHYDSNRYRGKDKYDIHKNKRYYSPERNRRLSRNYADEQCSRKDNNRMRNMKSPPPDRNFRYQRRNQEGRNRYDQEEYYDDGKNRNRYLETYRGKHKLPNDNEEPRNKRQRNNSHNPYPEQDKNRDGDRYSSSNCMLDDDIPHQYCQSPDYMVPETQSTQPTKEIMYTALTQLDDPRLLSKKYILDNNILSTVTGRNVDIKAIDTSSWDIVHVDIPKALTRRPSQCSEDIVRNIHMDIDNPVSNMSAESGEILSFETDALKAQDGVFHHSKQHNYSQVSHINTIYEKPNFKDSSEKYRIPKIQKRYDNQIKLKESNNDGKHLKNHSEGNSVERSHIQHNINEHSNVAENNLKSNILFKMICQNSKIKDSNELNFVKEIPSSKSDKCELKDSKTTKKTSVEYGLELSDETSDNIDVKKKFSTSQSTTENETPKNVTLNIDVTENTQQCLDTNTKAPISDTKEPKSKRRTEKPTTKELKCEETKTIKEKRNRPKKDKKETKEVKTKFSELFGDTTSSLITPEDLGIMAATAQNPQPSTKYVPICEDAQDAVDLKDIVKEDKQTPLLNLKSYDTNNLTGEVNTVIETENKVVSHMKERINNGNKYRNCRKNEDQKAVSANIENCETSMDLPILTEDLTIPIPTRTEVIKVLENNRPQSFEAVVKTNENKNVVIHKPDILLKALATSTPHKEFTGVAASVVTSCLPDANCSDNSKHDKVVDIGNTCTTTEQSFNNDTLDSQTDTDAPDVRIFVKRRRKIIKKAKPT